MSEEVISVAELVRRLRRAVEGETTRLWVEGEVGSLKRAPSGHAYFCLKDEREDAMLECVMYRLQAQRAWRTLADGARLQLSGKGTVWGPRGRLQFLVDRARPHGRGALLEALEQLKASLAAEGLFDVARKRPLPPDPNLVGLVTSGAGAALHDFRTVAFRRGRVRIVVAPTLVQGEAAPPRIVEALDRLERYPGLEVIVIARGGGSSEDLMAFNDERVVRRIAAAAVPVVSAVGHEVDTTLADLVADRRAATPSQAAEIVVPDGAIRREALVRLTASLTRAMRSRLLEDENLVAQHRLRLADPRFLIANRQQYVDELSLRLERAQRRAVARRNSQTDRLFRRLLGAHPRAVLAEAKGRLAPLRARLAAAMRGRLAADRSRLSRESVHLDALSPLSALARGYAIVQNGAGSVVREPRSVRVGEALQVTVQAGRIDVSVLRVLAGEGSEEARLPREPGAGRERER